jgi:hypothetical protein
LCTVRGCKYVARTKGFVDRKKLVLHVLEKHPGTELASSFRTEGFTKVKGQHKLKKLKKKPEPGAAARKKTKKADTTKKNNKPTRKKSTSAATPTMRRTPTPRREQEPVTWAHNLFGSPRAAAKAASDSDSDSDSDTSSSGGSSSSGDDGLGSDSDEDIARTDDEGEDGDERRPGVLDDGDAWETVKTEPEDDAIEISTDEEHTEPDDSEEHIEPTEPMEPEPRVEKPKPRSPQSPMRTKAPEKRAPVSNCPPPPLEPVPIDAHPFVADAPRIHATYTDDDEGAFTSLALRCIRARRRDVSSKRGSRKGKSRRGPKGSGSDETAPATRFADADEYAAYHRLLVLEDCASGAHDEFNLNTGAGRTTTRWKVQSGFTSVAALTAMSSIEGLATVVLTRDRKAEKNARTGGPSDRGRRRGAAVREWEGGVCGSRDRG